MRTPVLNKRALKLVPIPTLTVVSKWTWKIPIMIPGELLPETGEIELNMGRPTLVLAVANTGDRPVQVGSHFHFYEVNSALNFEREQTKGMRLDIPAGTAVRFEPGDQRQVTLVPLVGQRKIFGFNAQIQGSLEQS